ncbi:hypothetical protein NHF50_15145 [Flavobacterium sp. NRK F10]|uniref:hypothetical protein n=1 Tax=Flavobacterium sp. NRK F10 TaxID=2954931 RepID=UPI0020911C28|nr:hypothetical protein [Flavobacterium sp. NRK F10]MCO6176384.1 hypothetical protein [Flavobacterium sp. NRK F10]
MNKSKIIIALLVLSAINLTVMVPGGGIDTRDFSHIPLSILSVFNIFLTTLGMISLFLSYFIFRKYKWSILVAFICGLSYFLVYVLDFAHIFPKSPDSMPQLLVFLEAIGIILSIPLMLLSFNQTKKMKSSQDKSKLSYNLYRLVAFAIIVGIAIIVFATKSAMTGK